MARNRERWWTNVAIFLSLAAILFVVGMWTLSQDDRGKAGPRLVDLGGTDTGERRGRVNETDLDEREPADIRDLKTSVNRTSRFVNERQWPEAEGAAQEVRQRWVSFKPAMRANAGVRMWETPDIDDFQAALAALQGDVRNRDARAAQDKIETMQKIIDNYDDTEEGPANRPRPGRGERQEADFR